MGNIVAIDMGIVVLRITLFDRHNQLFPYKLQKHTKALNPCAKTYFMNDLSFYSKEHGGTFHFIQFNILFANQFLESLEFNHLMEFLEK